MEGARGDRWGPDGPPDDAYERVTEPERFAPLLAVCDHLIAWIGSTFLCRRFDGPGIDPEIEADPARIASIVRLEPEGGGAPITIATTTFPGAIVRVGRWLVRAMPACGCDACDDTASTATLDLLGLIDPVLSTGFREAMTAPMVGDGGYAYDLGTGSGWSKIPRSRAKASVGRHGTAAHEWTPWIRRQPQVS